MLEYQLEHPQRGTIDVRSFIRAIPRDDEIAETVGYTIDVTAQRQAERALRTVEARLESLLEQSPGVLFQGSISADGVPVGRYVSPNLRHLTGHPPEAFLDAERWMSLREPNQESAVDAVLQRARAEGSMTHEYRLRHADGHWIWLRSSFTALQEPSGDWVFTGYLLDVTEERKLRDALKHAQEELETVISSGPGVLWRVVNGADGQRVTTYVSPNVEQIIGLTFEQAIQQGAFAGRTGVELTKLRREALRAAGDAAHAVLEYPMRHTDGRAMWMREALRLVPRDDGSEEMVGYALDVSALQAAKTALADAEAKLAALVEDSPGVLFQSQVFPDMSWRNVYIAPNVMRLVGYDAEYVSTGHNWSSLVDPEMHGRWPISLQHALEQGQASREYRVRHRDGHWVWLRSTIRPTPLPEGGWRLTGYLMDITRERALDEALGRARADLEALIDASPGALFRAEVGADLSWRITYISAAAERVIGYTPEAWLGERPRLEAIDPVFHPVLEDAARRALRREAFTYEIRLRQGSGNWIWVRNTVRPDGLDRPAAEGAPVAIIGYCLDITREKEQATALAHAARVATLGELTGGVAHDFNNMLAAISNCHAVVRRMSTTPIVQEAIKIAQGAAERGANLVQQMLAFTRRREVEAESVDLAAMLSGLLGLLRHSCGEIVALDVNIPAGLWPVAAEAGALEMVVMNLATNARDAMPQGGRFSLEARNLPADSDEAEILLPADMPPRDYVVLTARDTGHGMSPSILARSTERFFTTKPAGQGTGLGLAMAEGFARYWGGVLLIESAPGSGTVVELVLRRANAASAGPGTQAPRDDKVRPLTILLVDDNEAVRRGVTILLEMNGHTVLEAGGAEHAAQIAESSLAIDLLLTDVVMPTTNGPALAASLRARRPGLAVVYMTGYAGPTLDSLDGGLLRKPFTEEALLAAMRTALSDTTGAPAAGPPRP